MKTMAINSRAGTINLANTLSNFPEDASIAFFWMLIGIKISAISKRPKINWTWNKNITPTIIPAARTSARIESKIDLILIFSSTHL